MTLEDVAKRARVSTATVSRVLNGAREVRPATRARVMRAVEELNYTPDLNARSLAGGQPRLLGMVVSNIANPFFLDIFRSVESCARQRGYDLIVANTDYDSYGDTYTDCYTYPNSYTYAHNYSYSNSYSHADSNRDADPNPNRCDIADSDTGTYSLTYAYPNSNRYAYTNSNRDCNAHTNPNTNSIADPNIFCDTITYTNSISDPNTYPNPNTYKR